MGNDGQTERRTRQRGAGGVEGPKRVQQTRHPKRRKASKQGGPKQNKPTTNRRPTTDNQHRTAPRTKQTTSEARSKNAAGTKADPRNRHSQNRQSQGQGVLQSLPHMGGGEPWSLCVGRFGTIQTPARGATNRPKNQTQANQSANPEPKSPQQSASQLLVYAKKF